MKKVIDIPDNLYSNILDVCNSHCWSIDGFITLSICFFLDVNENTERDLRRAESVFKRTFEVSRSIT